MTTTRRVLAAVLIPLVIAAWLALAGAAAASSADAVWPEHPGKVVKKDGSLVVDASHMDEGYVMACLKKSSKKRMKLRVKKGDTTLVYDIDSGGGYEVFPLQFGSGSYEFSLYENVKGNKYSSKGKIKLKASLKNESGAFLCPNQYVNYLPTSGAVLKSDELSAGAEKAKIYETICAFMKKEFTYDYIRAMMIASGELPEVDGCFDRRSGICQDLSAVMVCMLRVQGIPARLVIGYADKSYHAWTVSEVDGEEVFFDPTAELGALRAKKYSVERFY